MNGTTETAAAGNEIITGVLNVLFTPGDVTELRILKTRYKTISGYFDDMDALARAAMEWNGQAPAIYVTLNSVDPSLLARSVNHVTKWANDTTGDKHILRRRWLPLDFDPVRVSGISSTDQEHDYSIDVTKKAARFLADSGIPADSIVLGDSGNGAHVLVRIDLPNDDESTELVRRCIEAVALRFSDERISVDLTVHNAARIWKLYGTQACKGDSTAERPHRTAKLLWIPKQGIKVSPRPTLEKLAALAPEKPQANGNGIAHGFNLDNWLTEHVRDVIGPHAWNGGRKWLLDVCPWNPDHANRSAYIVQHAAGGIGAGCHHNGCVGKGWRDLRDTLEPGWQAARGSNGTANGTGQQGAPGPQNEAKDSFPHYRNKPCGINLLTWREFLRTTPDIRDDAIDNMAPDTGLVAVCGRGKQGKSTLMLHAVRSVANGLPFLNRRTKQKPVIYVNYEMPDAYVRTLLEASGEAPEKAYILNRPEPILRLETVEEILKSLSGSAIVIDSFRGAFRLQGDSENLAGGAGIVLRSLQDLAVKFNGLIFVIHHSNRSAREGTDGISGTGDWIAAPDVIWSWSRPDSEKPGILTVEGRIPPIEPLSINLSIENCIYTGTAKETQEQTDRDAIAGALTADGQTVDAIAQAINMPGGTVRKRLERMFEDGQVARAGEGKRGNPFLWSRIDSARIVSLGAESIHSMWEPI
jgi:AAA domain